MHQVAFGVREGPRKTNFDFWGLYSVIPYCTYVHVEWTPSFLGFKWRLGVLFLCSFREHAAIYSCFSPMVSNTSIASPALTKPTSNCPQNGAFWILVWVFYLPIYHASAYVHGCFFWLLSWKMAWSYSHAGLSLWSCGRANASSSLQLPMPKEHYRTTADENNLNDSNLAAPSKSIRHVLII